MWDYVQDCRWHDTLVAMMPEIAAVQEALAEEGEVGLVYREDDYADED